MSTIKPYSPACERNRDPILSVLRAQFADRRRVLEIGSGTGQHASYFAAALPQLTWQATDVADNLPGIRLWLDEAGLPNTPAPLVFDCDHELQNLPLRSFDAVFTANTLHIMSWPQVQTLFERLASVMTEDAKLVVYGPFNRAGQFTSDSNRAFDAALRQANPLRGIRDFEAVAQLAKASGLRLIDDRALPSNNTCLTWTASPA